MGIQSTLAPDHYHRCTTTTTTIPPPHHHHTTTTPPPHYHTTTLPPHHHHLHTPPVHEYAINYTLLSAADYSVVSNPRTFDFRPTNPIRMCISISLIDDGRVEANVEHFFLNLSLVPVARVNIDPEQARVDIMDSNGMKPI